MKSTTELTTLSVLFTSPALRHHPGKDFRKKPQTSQGVQARHQPGAACELQTQHSASGTRSHPVPQGMGAASRPGMGRGGWQPWIQVPFPLPCIHNCPIPAGEHRGRDTAAPGQGIKAALQVPNTAWPNTHLPVHRNSLSWAPPIKGSIHKRREKGQPETGKEKENSKFKTEKANSLWKKHSGAQSSQEVRLPCLRNNKPPSFTSSK